MAFGNAMGGVAPEIAPEDARSKLEKKIRGIRLQDEERETAARATRLGLAYFNLQSFPVSPDALGVVPEADAQKLQLVCFWVSAHDLRFGAVDPQDATVQNYIADLGKAHHLQAEVYLITPESLRKVLEAYKRLPSLKKVPGGVSISQADLERVGNTIASIQDLENLFHGAATTEIVTLIMAGGLKTRASDIHLEAEEFGIALRYRIDGVLHNVAEIQRGEYQKLNARMKLLAGLKINVSDRPQDGRFTISLAEDKIDVRVSSLPTSHGESMVMRLLRASKAGVTFESLGISGRAKEQLLLEMKKPNGMIISTGPTGSGKTTTLYAMLNDLNGPSVKIITIEDPIEYRLKGINQSQVEHDSGYTFASGLRSILRQDPDVIMVGEIRDPETAELAVQAALTGHLVISTLHTNDAAGTIPRLHSLGAKPTLLPSSLNAILGQRLVRRLCESCKVAQGALDAVTQKLVDDALATLPAPDHDRLTKDRNFLKAVGCEACQNLGYKGQIGIYEVLLMSKEIKKAAAEEGTTDVIIQELAQANGMVTMMQDGILKALEGITSLEEVFRVTKG